MPSLLALQDPDGTEIFTINDDGSLTIKDASGTEIFVVSSAGQLTNLYGIRRAAGTISSAQLLALNATPITLVAAPGAGSYLDFVSGRFYKPAGTAYADIAAGDDIAIKYTNGSGEEVARVECTGFLDQTTAQGRNVQGPGAKDAVADYTPVDNAALVAHMLTGEVTTGNSPLHFEIFYQVKTTILTGA
jgi:hypothetical protein